MRALLASSLGERTNQNSEIMALLEGLEVLNGRKILDGLEALNGLKALNGLEVLFYIP